MNTNNLSAIAFFVFVAVAAFGTLQMALRWHDQQLGQLVVYATPATATN